MPEKRFTPGQSIVCKDANWTFDAEGYIPIPMPHEPPPQLGQVYTVGYYDDYENGEWYIHLVELPIFTYGQSGFEPLVEDAVLAEELDSIFSPVFI